MSSKNYVSICTILADPIFSFIKHILRYLKGTLDCSLHLYSSSPHTLVAACSDWARCLDTKRSTSGLCMFLGENLIAWSSRCQTTISHISAEAEYRVVAFAVTESWWVRQLLQELQCPVQSATIIYYDNVSDVYLSANPVHHRQTKHIDLDIHFCCEKVALGAVHILLVPAICQYDNIFTKGLSIASFSSVSFQSSCSFATQFRPPRRVGGLASTPTSDGHIRLCK
jgi:hypothetical protein